MSEILDYYQQQAAQNLRSEIPFLLNLQAQALSDFERFGFPTRQVEDWKYTDVGSFLTKRFERASFKDAGMARGEHAPSVGLPIHLVNGQISGIEHLTGDLPNGVMILPLAQAMIDCPEKIQPYLGRILPQEHGFQALNTAMLQSGLLIYVPAGVCLEAPLLLSHWQDEADQAVYLRHVIVAEEGSLVSVIEDYDGHADCSYFTNAMTEVFAAAHAQVNHYKIQRESKQSYHISHVAVTQSEGSQVNNHLLSLGGKLVRCDLSIRLRESHARCLLNGLYAPSEGQHMDHHTAVYHEVPNCQSDQDYKGMLSGRARAVFNGKVLVEKDAQKTVAHQQNKNLLLSAQAEIDTKPQLEIFADDVQCTHGATVGQLDEDALFYLATRGIERAEASQYLIQAFAVENLRRVPHTALADWMGQLLKQQLG